MIEFGLYGRSEGYKWGSLVWDQQCISHSRTWLFQNSHKTYLEDPKAPTDDSQSRDVVKHPRRCWDR